MKLVNESPQADMSVVAIRKRIAALRKSSPNGPKGGPPTVTNQTDTNPLYPVDHAGPADRRWDPSTMITGSGNGPEFGSSSL